MIEKVVLPLVLAFLMFGLGMALNATDLARLARRKMLVFVSLLSLLFLMPCIAYEISRLYHLDPLHASGLILLAACPGGMFSNLVTHSAKGSLALSMTLTALSSVVYVLTIPMVLSISMPLVGLSVQNIQLDAGDVIVKVALVVLAPAVLGFFLRYKKPEFCRKAEGWVRRLATGFVALVFLDLAIEQHAVLIQSGPRLVCAVLMLNAAAWIVAAIVGAVFRCSFQERIALGVEHAIRQEGTGVFIAASLLAQPQMALPLLVNALSGLAVSSLVVYVAEKLGKRKAKAGPRSMAVNV